MKNKKIYCRPFKGIWKQIFNKTPKNGVTAPIEKIPCIPNIFEEMFETLDKFNEFIKIENQKRAN
jgi:hypothetical protein